MERERLKSTNEQIYHSVWKAFDKEFIDPSLALNGKSDFLEERIGRVVFDSRGLGSLMSGAAVRREGRIITRRAKGRPFRRYPSIT
jgi:hypothetical protein